MLTRRSTLSFVGLGTLALAGCTTTTSGGVTTVTLDVATITRDGHAIVKALSATLIVPAMAVLLGPNLALAQTALGAASGAMDQIETLTGGAISLSIDTGKVQATVTSLLTDVQSVLSLVQGALGTVSISGTAVGDLSMVSQYVAAASTLVAFVQVAADLVPVALKAKAVAHPMSEKEALAVAGGGH